MTRSSVSLYPPRAGWWSRVWYWGRYAKRVVRLPSTSGNHGLTDRQIVLGFLIPGQIYDFLGYRLVARCVGALYVVALLLSLAKIGYQEANLAYGLLISIHASSIFQVLSCLYGPFPLTTRLAVMITTMVSLLLVLYLPLAYLVNARVATPLQTYDGVVVVKPLSSGTPERNDILAYGIPAGNFTERDEIPFVIRAGADIGPVLGMSGDHVEFDNTHWYLNGQVRDRLPGMPDQGELHVPEGHVFVWPELSRPHTQALLKVCMVSTEEVIGRPYRKWFGRTQPLP